MAKKCVCVCVCEKPELSWILFIGMRSNSSVLITWACYTHNESVRKRKRVRNGKKGETCDNNLSPNRFNFQQRWKILLSSHNYCKSQIFVMLVKQKCSRVNENRTIINQIAGAPSRWWFSQLDDQWEGKVSHFLHRSVIY